MPDKLKVGQMVEYVVKDIPERIFPARGTWPNEDGTADLLVMVHPEDFPEFSKAQCAAGHAHRLAVKEGTEPGMFRTITAPAAGQDPRVGTLVTKVAELETLVADLTTKMIALTQPKG